MLERDARCAKLVVSDTGPGLEEAELSKIFEPFYRGRGNTGSSGAGLGLAIVARVLQGHGGSVSARNLHASSGAISGLEIVLRWPLDLKLARADQTVAAHADRVPRSRE
jgi:signal transduction histidine kinase